MNWYVDLPHLNSINLGEYALAGRNNDDCSLKMESNIDMNELILDLPNLTSITSNGDSFSYPRSITLSSNLMNVLWSRHPQCSNCESSQFIPTHQNQVNRQYRICVDWQTDVATLLQNIAQTLYESNLLVWT